MTTENRVVRMFINNTAWIRDHSSSEADASQGLCFAFKPWPNGLTSSRKKPQVELAWRRESGLTDSQGSSQVQASCNKTHFKAFKAAFHGLTGCYNNEWTSLALTWDGWEKLKNMRQIDLGQSERESSHVNASTRKAWPNRVASRPKFSTCVYLRVRLATKLNS